MRKLFIIFLSCAAVLLVGYAGYRSYRVWKNKHLMTLAHQFLQKKDGRNAALAVETVLRSAPNNLDAVRVMAQLADASHSSAAFLWRSRVVELDPQSVEDRLALAQTALAAHDYISATNALEGISAAGKATPAYHNVAGAVDAAINRPAEAEAHFLEAARLDPQNPAPQLNLAVVRLHGTNATELSEARSGLQRLAANPTNSVLRCEALRELILDAAAHKQKNTALALSEQLMRETNSAFMDRILRLELLREDRDPEFKPTLRKFEREAAGDQARVYELGRWEMAKVSPSDALSWMRTLPASIQTNQPTTLMITECYAVQHDWRGLQAWLEKQQWAELDFTRHAFLSRALRGQDLDGSSKAEWGEALQDTKSQKQALVMLLRLAAQWNWGPEGEEILWSIVNKYPQEKWANLALSQILYVRGRTRSLMELYKQQLERNPSDLTVKNNLAFTALLLEAKELNPNEMAREVYEKQPTNASFASTYAFSLYVQGKSGEALKIMRKLTPRELNDPATAGYYGLILKASGNRVSAKAYLDETSKGTLLPEERKLFDTARMGT